MTEPPKEHPFSTKGLPPNYAIALQILGYSTLSLLAENLQETPEAHIHTFQDTPDPLQGMIECVGICVPLSDLYVFAANHILYNYILHL